MTQTVQADSLVTLHYRLALESGQDLVSTFDSTPATLKLGSGELAPNLEKCLVGLQPGEMHAFLLAPEEAFGTHNPALMERIRRSLLPGAAELEEMSMIEFSAPNGAKYSGMVRELSAEHALIDFNHPLAGQTVRFEVQVIGIL